MTKELETLLTELYVLIDDHVVEPRRGRGRRPVLADAELLTLAVAQMLLGFDSERRWIRYARDSDELRALFPYIPAQSGYLDFRTFRAGGRAGLGCFGAPEGLVGLE